MNDIRDITLDSFQVELLYKYFDGLLNIPRSKFQHSILKYSINEYELKNISILVKKRKNILIRYNNKIKQCCKKKNNIKNKIVKCNDIEQKNILKEELSLLEIQLKNIKNKRNKSKKFYVRKKQEKKKILSTLQININNNKKFEDIINLRESIYKEELNTFRNAVESIKNILCTKNKNNILSITYTDVNTECSLGACNEKYKHTFFKYKKCCSSILCVSCFIKSFRLKFNCPFCRHSFIINSIKNKAFDTFLL
jgi:hypothetical protein